MKSAKLGLLTAMGIFGTVGIFVRFIPLPSATIAFFRAGLGLVFLLLFTAATRRRLDWKTAKAHLGVLFLSGVALGCNWILLFEAYRYTTVATATICYYLAPMFLLLASPLLGERLTVRKLICILISLLGMVFVSGVLQGGISGLTGILLGVAAAILYASVVLLNKRLQAVGAYDKTIIQLGTSAIVILPYILVSGGFDLTTAMVPVNWLLLAVVGIVHTGIAYSLYFGSIKNLNSQTIAVFSYLDPVISILLSALLLKESLDIYGVIGAVLILGSALYNELLEKKN